jgi:hypothetical protein
VAEVFLRKGGHDLIMGLPDLTDEVRQAMNSIMGWDSNVPRAKPAAERAAGRPKPLSKAALRRRLREAEAQASALRVQLAQLDEAAGTHGLAESSER